jgi:hypothetical protein
MKMSKTKSLLLLALLGCGATPKKVVTQPTAPTNVEVHDNYCEVVPEAYDCLLEAQSFSEEG